MAERLVRGQVGRDLQQVGARGDRVALDASTHAFWSPRLPQSPSHESPSHGRQPLRRGPPRLGAFAAASPACAAVLRQSTTPTAPLAPQLAGSHSRRGTMLGAEGPARQAERSRRLAGCGWWRRWRRWRAAFVSIEVALENSWLPSVSGIGSVSEASRKCRGTCSNGSSGANGRSPASLSR